MNFNILKYGDTACDNNCIIKKNKLFRIVRICMNYKAVIHNSEYVKNMETFFNGG